MPEIGIYLPENLYIKLKAEDNRSELVQRLLKKHYQDESKKEDFVDVLL